MLPTQDPTEEPTALRRLLRETHFPTKQGSIEKNEKTCDGHFFEQKHFHVQGHDQAMLSDSYLQYQ